MIKINLSKLKFLIGIIFLLYDPTLLLACADLFKEIVVSENRIREGKLVKIPKRVLEKSQSVVRIYTFNTKSNGRKLMWTQHTGFIAENDRTIYTGGSAISSIVANAKSYDSSQLYIYGDSRIVFACLLPCNEAKFEWTDESDSSVPSQYRVNIGRIVLEKSLSLKPLEFRKAPPKKITEIVYTISYSLGHVYYPQVSKGKVNIFNSGISAHLERIPGLYEYSGSPLLDSSGNVIGILNFSLKPQGNESNFIYIPNYGRFKNIIEIHFEK